MAYGLTRALNQPVPQISKTAQTMIHGMSENHTSAVVGATLLFGLGGAMVAAMLSRLRSAGDVQTSGGCHTFRNRMRQAIEVNDAPISTIHGLM